MKEVFAFIDEHTDEYVEKLRWLCRQPSVSIEGLGLDQTAQMARELLNDAGAKARIITVEGEAAYVYGEVAGKSDKTLGFYNHYDVHPPGPSELWQSPPFGAEIRKGRVYGRGATDNKGNLVARLCAVDAYQKVYGSLPVRVKFLYDGEEEIGSPHLSQFVEQHSALLQADAWIWEGGFKDANERLEIYLGFNGLCHVQLEVTTAHEELHSLYCGMVPSAVWRLVWALASIKDGQEHVKIAGFYDPVLPPTEEELRIMRELPLDTARFRRTHGISDWAGGLSGEALLRRHFLEPHVNIPGFRGGYTGPGVKAVLPHKAIAKMELYLVPNQDAADAARQLRDHLQSEGFGDVEVEVLALINPVKTDLNDPLAKLLVSAAQGVYGHEPVVYPIMPGASPMYLLTRRFGVSGVSTGVGYIGSNYHLPNENVRISDYIEGIKLMAAVIDLFAKI